MIAPTGADIGRGVRYLPYWEQDRTADDPAGQLAGLPKPDHPSDAKVRFHDRAGRLRQPVLVALRDLEWLPPGGEERRSRDREGRSP